MLHIFLFLSLKYQCAEKFEYFHISILKKDKCEEKVAQFHVSKLNKQKVAYFHITILKIINM